MKKVGLAVVTYKDNFGSALQTYATQHIIEKIGYEPECICTDNIMKEIEIRKIMFFMKRIFVPEELKHVWTYATSRLKRKGSSNYSDNMKIRHKKYVEFYDKYLYMSRKINSFDDFSKLCLDYQSVVVGSDQLWRPSNIAGGYFTLEKVPDNINKVAYSTSFGVKELPLSMKKRAKNFLSRINHISVREDTGKKIVFDAIKRDIPVVCDPTMLLSPEEWFSLAREAEVVIKEKYIVCYLMGDNKEQRKFIKKLREITGYKVVGLLHGATYIADDEKWVDEKPFDIGPLEFINLIRDAEYVCTDSFHCCVFSIIGKTPFFVFRRDSEKGTTSANDRIYTLLKWSSLENRLLDGDESVKDCISRKINFEEVHNKMKIKQKKSLEYLEEALKDGKKDRIS